MAAKLSTPFLSLKMQKKRFPALSVESKFQNEKNVTHDIKISPVNTQANIEKLLKDKHLHPSH